MNKFTSLLLIPALAVGLISCSDSTEPATNGPSGPESVESTEYPLDVCVVSGEKLGSMGDPITLEVEGHTFKICCASCEKKLRATPDKYIKMLESGEVGGSHEGHDGHSDGDHSGHDH